MSLFEFQMSTSKFLVAQRNYLRLLALCPPTLPAVGGVQIVMDRIDVGPSSLRQGEETDFPVFLEDGGEVRATHYPATGYPVLLEQSLTLQLATEEDIRAHPNSTPRLVPVDVVLRFQVSADALQDECYLRASLNSVEFHAPALPPPFPATLPASVVSAVESFLRDRARLFAPSGTVPMGLRGQLRKGVSWLNAGLALDATGQTLAIRVQMGGSSWYSYLPWTTFHQGHFPDRRQGHDWALFVESDYLTESAKDILGRSLPSDDDLDAYPNCTYTVDGGRPVLDVSAHLIYHAVEVQELDIDITVAADPHVLLRPSIDTPNWLSVEIDFARITEVKGFISTFALSVTRLFGIPVEELLLRLAGSAAVDELEEQGADEVTETSPTTIRVDQAIAVPTIPGSVRTAATHLLALADGIAIAGSMTATELTTAVPATEVVEFKVAAPRVSCGPASVALVAAFLDSPSGFRVLHASAAIRNKGTAPLKLCRPLVVERVDAPVKTTDIRADTGQPPMDLQVDIPAPDPAYYQNPYPIDVLVHTNGGTRLLRFAPLPFIDPARYEGLAAELLAAIADCQQLVDPWLKTHAGYNPRWSPRPPEDGSAVQHLWEVVISGLPAGQAAQLSDSGGRVLVKAVSAGSPVHLTAVVSPTGNDREVSIERVGAPEWSEAPSPIEDAAGAAAGGLEVRQTNLVVAGVVNLRTPARSIMSVSVSGIPTVVALFDDQAVAYATSSASPAAAVTTWPGRFTGMLKFRQGLLLYGEDGLASVDPSGRLTRTAVDVPISDATLGPDGVFAVTHDRILALSPALTLRNEIAAPGAVAAVHARGRLVVSNRHAIEVLNGVADLHRTTVGEASVMALTRVPFVDPGAVLATFDDASARVLVPGEDGLQEVARYDTAPWFTNALRIDDRVVRLADSKDRLELYRFGASVAR